METKIYITLGKRFCFCFHGRRKAMDTIKINGIFLISRDNSSSNSVAIHSKLTSKTNTVRS